MSNRHGVEQYSETTFLWGGLAIAIFFPPAIVFWIVYYLDMTKNMEYKV
jgi:hypothetical protein